MMTEISHFNVALRNFKKVDDSVSTANEKLISLPTNTPVLNSISSGVLLLQPHSVCYDH